MDKLESTTANRRLIDELAAHNIISTRAREAALSLVYPALNWGLWIARLLMVLGSTLILSGIIYFFAFNWTKIGPAIKLFVIQVALAGCLTASFLYGINRKLAGKISLLSASVLVGVFLAVFGQIYQTGADAYTLFLWWAVLILPWTLISEFVALWIVWLAISNVAISLYCLQTIPHEDAINLTIINILIIFNSIFLGLREWLAIAKSTWLDDRWSRTVLITAILALVLIPTMAFIFNPRATTNAAGIGVMLSIFLHTLFYGTYRAKIPDMWAVATTVLSCCLVTEAAIFKFTIETVKGNGSAITFIMGAVTLGIFTIAISNLRKVAKAMKGRK